MWYCVHAIHLHKILDGLQDSYPCIESMYLINAESFDEAKFKGKSRAKQDETGTDGSITVDGRPAQFKFVSIRKVVECQDLDPSSGNPTDGTELSYSEFTADDIHDYSNLVHAFDAKVVYRGKEMMPPDVE